jgi:hypothetical protein
MLVGEETDTVATIVDDATMDSTKYGTLQILILYLSVSILASQP